MHIVRPPHPSPSESDTLGVAKLGQKFRCPSHSSPNITQHEVVTPHDQPEPPHCHVYQGGRRSWSQGRGDHSRKRMANAPAPGLQVSRAQCELLWTTVLKRTTVLTLSPWVPPGQSPEPRRCGEVVPGTWSRQRGVRRDQAGETGTRESQLRVVFLSCVPRGTPAQPFLGSL